MRDSGGGARPALRSALAVVDKAIGATGVADVEDGKAVAKPADPSFAGYEFVGWFTDEAAKNLYDFDAPVTGDLTLYVGYKKVVSNTSTSDDGKKGEKAQPTKALPQTEG